MMSTQLIMWLKFLVSEFTLRGLPPCWNPGFYLTGWFMWERVCGSFLFFSDLQLHETRADLSHKREQVVVTRKWGLESHTHVLRLPGMEDLWHWLIVYGFSWTVSCLVPCYCCCSVAKSHPTLCDPARLFRPLLSSGVCSNSCPLSQWC